MSELNPSQSRRVDGIIEHVEEYLTLRFAHAERVNPKISQFVDDLKAQLLHGLRLILSHGKSWGAEKFMVADILCGDDLRKRYEIFNLTGQFSGPVGPSAPGANARWHAVLARQHPPPQDRVPTHASDLLSIYRSVRSTRARRPA